MPVPKGHTSIEAYKKFGDSGDAYVAESARFRSIIGDPEVDNMREKWEVTAFGAIHPALRVIVQDNSKVAHVVHADPRGVEVLTEGKNEVLVSTAVCGYNTLRNEPFTWKRFVFGLDKKTGKLLSTIPEPTCAVCRQDPLYKAALADLEVIQAEVQEFLNFRDTFS